MNKIIPFQSKETEAVDNSTRETRNFLILELLVVQLYYNEKLK